MGNSQKFKPTIILIALNVAVYISTSVVGRNFLNTNFDLMVQYGQVNSLVIYSGYYYQLFTSMFIHADIAHIVGNMLFLLIFGL